MRMTISIALLSIGLVGSVSAGVGTVPRLPDPDERTRILLTPSPEAGRAQPLDPREELGLASQDDFDVTHYFLKLDFDESIKRVSGSVRVTATSLVDDLTQVQLNLTNNMTVTSVTRAAVGVAFTHQSNLVTVTLDPAVDNGESFELNVRYNGSPVSGSFGWDKYSTTGPNTDMVWSLSQPNGGRTWWPSKDRPDDKALVEAWWTVRPDWTATGNGVLQGVDTLPTGRKRYRWLATHPLPTYLVSVAATNYATFSHTYTPLAGGSMPIDYYVYPEDLADSQLPLSVTADMLTFMAQTFGEYPFVEDKYGISEFPFFGAMEHSTNSSYGFVLLNGTNDFDFVNLHEIAHQWWGDAVSPETWDDMWLNEGFSSYCEALWFEHLGGATPYRDYMVSLDLGAFPGPVYAPVNVFASTVYNKGAWVMHMMRRVMGDEAFFQSLRNWYIARFDGTGNTVQFQANQEAAHGASLDYFFQQWVYNESRPAYRYGFTTADLGNGSYRNYVRVEQTQLDAGVFSMPLDLALELTSGDDVRTVWNDQAIADYVFDTSEPLPSLVLDPFNWVLKGPVDSFVLADADIDGVPDYADNCPSIANPVQADADADLAGDPCDSDDDNDLLDDTLDCAPTDAAQGVPDEVVLAGLDVGGIAWEAAARADTYDVVRGSMGSLQGGLEDCLVTGLSTLSYADPAVPDSGAAYGYLVRGVDAGCGGPGSLGGNSAGVERPSPCP